MLRFIAATRPNNDSFIASILMESYGVKGIKEETLFLSKSLGLCIFLLLFFGDIAPFHIFSTILSCYYCFTIGWTFFSLKQPIQISPAFQCLYMILVTDEKDSLAEQELIERL